MKAVIDTNVLLVAEGKHNNVTDDCLENCVKALKLIKDKGVVVIDDEFRILCEYQNKLDNTSKKMPGSAFLKWLLQNKKNKRKVHVVSITELEQDIFNEFPDMTLQYRFDPPDRKFVAVAAAHPHMPPVWQAVDCKWLNWWEELLCYGVEVKFCCPIDILSLIHI